MTSKKFFSAAILSLAVLFTACSAGGTEVLETVSETISETVTTTAAETTSTASETTAETTTAETEIIDTSGVEYMKEALKTDWDNSAAAKDVTGSSGMTAADLYVVDLNGDGVKELFVNYSFGAGADGFVCVYDVSDGMKKLYEISARIWADKAELYTDTDENVHFILANGYSTWVSTYDYAFFDITYDSIKIPFYIDDYQYHNDVGHVFESDIYTNCEVVPNVETFKGWRNFDPEKAEYIGRFDPDYVISAIDYGESNEISETIQKEVYEDLTYVSDIEMICESSGNIIDYKIVWDFEEFWQEVAPKLAKIYNN
ncbi:MAG: hypothetical protein HDT25_05545 [Ruminococcus sp.]|nr:hypothetical protein [Ruminococcus sp.]